MNCILKTTDLHKRYGRIKALNKVSLSVNRGEVFGLLGPNGSGKTTALGMLLGVTNPTSGSFEWFGNSNANQARKRIGAILEKPNFYESYNAVINLKLSASIRQAPVKNIDKVLKQVGLFERRYDSFRTYSLGMKQRLAIASALLNDPDVLILDEPTNGLDPQGISEMRSLILDISHSGKTIILASHLLDEVQKVCSHFAILQKGNLIYSGKVDEDLGDYVYIEVGAENLSEMETILKNHPLYVSHKPIKNAVELKLQKEAQPAEINSFLINNDIVVNHLVMNKKSLEQQFLEILENRN